MKPWESLETITADGITLKLARHDGEFLLLADGFPLMSSRMHGSEDDLATIGCRRARLLPAPCVLVGGLGMGFTLRAALDLLPSAATVVVSELIPAVVAWNRGVLAPLAGRPLDDPRVGWSNATSWRCFARIARASTPHCWISTTGPVRSRRTATAHSTPTGASPWPALPSNRREYWPCGRRFLISSTRGACGTADSTW